MSSKTKEQNGLVREVLDFLSKQESKKLVRCQCGIGRQEVGMLCDSCGEIVQDD